MIDKVHCVACPNWLGISSYIKTGMKNVGNLMCTERTIHTSFEMRKGLPSPRSKQNKAYLRVMRSRQKNRKQYVLMYSKVSRVETIFRIVGRAIPIFIG